MVTLVLDRYSGTEGLCFCVANSWNVVHAFLRSVVVNPTVLGSWLCIPSRKTYTQTSAGLVIVSAQHSITEIRFETIFNSEAFCSTSAFIQEKPYSLEGWMDMYGQLSILLRLYKDVQEIQLFSTHLLIPLQSRYKSSSRKCSLHTEYEKISSLTKTAQKMFQTLNLVLCKDCRTFSCESHSFISTPFRSRQPAAFQHERRLVTLLYSQHCARNTCSSTTNVIHQRLHWNSLFWIVANPVCTYGKWGRLRSLVGNIPSSTLLSGISSAPLEISKAIGGVTSKDIY